MFFPTFIEDQNRVLLFQRRDVVSGWLCKIAELALDFRKKMEVRCIPLRVF